MAYKPTLTGNKERLVVKTDEENQIYLWKSKRGVYDEICIKQIIHPDNSVTFILYDYSIPKKNRKDGLKIKILYGENKYPYDLEICPPFSKKGSYETNRSVEILLNAFLDVDAYVSRYPLSSHKELVSKLQEQLTYILSTP